MVDYIKIKISHNKINKEAEKLKKQIINTETVMPPLLESRMITSYNLKLSPTIPNISKDSIKI